MKFKKILFSFLALVFIAIIVLGYLLLNPFQYVPPVGRDLPSNIREARQAFKDRVTEKYAIGMQEEDLMKDLQDQRFELDVGDNREGDKQAVFGYSVFPCSYVLDIKWNSDETSKIVSVKGDRRLSCL